MNEITLILNGVPVKCKGELIDWSGGTAIQNYSVVTPNPPQPAEMSLKELAQRLKELNEMDSKGDRDLYEKARLLDDELDMGGSGLRISYWDTDQAYCVYVKEGV